MTYLETSNRRVERRWGENGFRYGGVVLLVAALMVAVGCSDLGKTLEPATDAQVSPGALDFGTVAAGDTAARQVTITNSGTADLTGSVATTGAQFPVLAGGGPFTLAPGQELVVTVDFTPVAEGQFAAELSFGAAAPAVPLHGVCSNPASGFAVEIAPTQLSFGNVTVGQSSTRSFVVRSVGTAAAALDVTASCPDFQITAGGGAASVAPGDSVSVSVRYAPSAAGPSTCTVNVGPGCPTVALSGTGVAVQLVSFARDVQPIYTAKCATSGCHRGNSPDGHLDLTAAVSYAQTVNRASHKYAPALLIRPNDLSGSVIYGKIANTHQYGGRMPEGSSLSTTQINTIKNWILQGALNN